MKLTVNENSNICLEEVFNGIELKSTDGESIGICMRDSGFEMRVGEKWYTINNGSIKFMSSGENILDAFDKIHGYTMVENSELDQLKKDSEKLRNLEAAGVDNWEGFE